MDTLSEMRRSHPPPKNLWYLTNFLIHRKKLTSLPSQLRIMDTLQLLKPPANSKQFLTQAASPMKLPSIDVFPFNQENQTLPLAVRRRFATPGRGGDEAGDQSERR